MSDRLHESDEALLLGLRVGDEAAFATLVDSLNGRLLALARTFTSSPALAEDIVQDTWLGVIRGLRGFEGRSTLRTWIFSILVRRARTMAGREGRPGLPRLPAAGGGGGGGGGGGQIIMHFSLTLSLSLRERGRNLIVFATCSEFP